MWVAHDGMTAWIADPRGWLAIGVNRSPSRTDGALLRKRTNSMKGCSSGCGPGRPVVCTNGTARLATTPEAQSLARVFSGSGMPFRVLP